MEEVIDTTLLRGRVKLVQPRKGFHASTDTVMLAAAVTARPGFKLLDAGCGVGSAGLCAISRIKGIFLTGLELQPEMADLARLNARLNGMEDRMQVITGDIRTERSLPEAHFNCVMINPPYMEGGTHTPSPDKKRALALGEEAGGATLADWVKFAHKRLKSGGTLTMIHRADRLDDIILELEKKRWFGAIAVFPLWSKAGQAAKRVIVRARKERSGPFTLSPGMIVHNEDGSYTPAAEKILSDMEALVF